MDFWVILRTVDEGKSCGIGFITMRERKRGQLVVIQQVICPRSLGYGNTHNLLRGILKFCDYWDTNRNCLKFANVIACISNGPGRTLAH